MSEFLDETIMHKNTMNHIKLDGTALGEIMMLIKSVNNNNITSEKWIE